MSYYGLIVTILLILALLLYLLKQKNKSQLQKIFIIDLLLPLGWDIGIFLQYLLCNKYNLNPFIFECFVYIFVCPFPIALYFTGLIFTYTKLNFKRIHMLLFVVPIISLILLWTNNFHHLFYINYSINMNETIFGKYFLIYSLYTYLIFGIAIYLLLKYSIRNAGFFSKQSMLIVVGTLIPLVTNILGTFNLMPMTVYVTPISFSFAVLFYALAIFKFKFLSVTPIAMQKIVDRMSDSFLVVNEENIITDFNETLLNTFKLTANEARNKNILELLSKFHILDFNAETLAEILKNCKSTTETFMLKKDFKIANKYFNIEVCGIFSKQSYIGTLILLKDVTQHIVDRNIIENNQSLLMEKERLASLGQMIGGIAHNLKTPIMSIAGAAEGLSDLTKEYDLSIGDPEVTNEDHHEIVKDMDEWIAKIKTHTSYMSDVISAVKGQAVAFSETSVQTFTIKELLTHIDVLMKHELKNALIELNTSVQVPESLSINGNINSLVQVINNIISNAIQAYNGTTNKSIDFTIKLINNDVVFIIQDYGCGMPKKVQDKLFKEMITTKGKNGTGLGMFMSYSNIRAHFNGNMVFESEEGKGTKFEITIPINK